MYNTCIFLEDLKKKCLERLIMDYYWDTVNESKIIQSFEIDKDLYGYNPECPEESELIQYIYVVFTDGTRDCLEWDCLKKLFY